MYLREIFSSLYQWFSGPLPTTQCCWFTRCLWPLMAGKETSRALFPGNRLLLWQSAVFVSAPQNRRTRAASYTRLADSHLAYRQRSITGVADTCMNFNNDVSLNTAECYTARMFRSYLSILIQYIQTAASAGKQIATHHHNVTPKFYQTSENDGIWKCKSVWWWFALMQWDS